MCVERGPDWGEECAWGGRCIWRERRAGIYRAGIYRAGPVAGSAISRNVATDLTSFGEKSAGAEGGAETRKILSERTRGILLQEVVGNGATGAGAGGGGGKPKQGGARGKENKKDVRLQHLEST